MFRHLVVSLFVLVVFRGVASGQFTTVIDVPPDVAPGSIGSDTQVNLFAGGALGDGFEMGASDGSSTNLELNIFGGTVGMDFQSYGGVVNIRGGLFNGDNHRFRNTTVSVLDGSLGSDFWIEDGSVIHVLGGTVGNDLIIESGGRANILSGNIDINVDVAGGQIDIFAGEVDMNVETGGVANIWGGENETDIEDGGHANVHGGSFPLPMFAEAGSSVRIFGTSFLLDGQAIVGLNGIGDTVEILARDGAALSATLRDGTRRDFVLNSLLVSGEDRFDMAAQLEVTLATAIPEPSALIVFGLLALPRRGRRRVG